MLYVMIDRGRVLVLDFDSWYDAEWKTSKREDAEEGGEREESKENYRELRDDDTG